MKKNMPESAPELLALNHDDYSAKYVGKTADGRQFFLTTPFVPAIGNNPGREFLSLYLFDAAGKLLEARIEDLGSRQNPFLPGQVDPSYSGSLAESWLAELGDVDLCNIEVAPFRVERFKTEFGLIPYEPEEKGEEWSVVLMPGNYMAFYPPWDGDYDT